MVTESVFHHHTITEGERARDTAVRGLIRQQRERGLYPFRSTNVFSRASKKKKRKLHLYYIMHPTTAVSPRGGGGVTCIKNVITSPLAPQPKQW